MASDKWLWIERWNEFQHYKPERDRAPAWIKTYTKQLDDDAYQELTPFLRAALHDLRLAFARSHGRLSSDARRLSQRTGLRITAGTLKSLSEAGFVSILSREALDKALETLYTSPRARVEEEGEREKDSIRESKLQDISISSSDVSPEASLETNLFGNLTPHEVLRKTLERK